VDAFVTRGGRPVTGLTASQFELLDEGRLQRPELLAAEALPLTTLLVFDASESVRGAKLHALREAANVFLLGLRPQDEVGVIAFSAEVRRVVPPTSDKAAVRRALAELQGRGPTALWDALSVAIALLAPRSRGLVVLFSDGADNMSWLDASRVKEQAARANAVVQVVGVAAAPPYEPAYVGELRETAEATGGRFWRADSPDDLAAAFASIMDAMNSRYLLRYDPGPDAAPGWHRIEIRLKGAKGEVSARRGYWRSR
jgi:VWFA-related protein